MLQTVIAAEAPFLFTASSLVAQTATDCELDSVSFICCHNDVVGVAVGALYERPFFCQSTRYAPTAHSSFRIGFQTHQKYFRTRMRKAANRGFEVKGWTVARDLNVHFSYACHSYDCARYCLQLLASGFCDNPVG